MKVAKSATNIIYFLLSFVLLQHRKEEGKFAPSFIGKKHLGKEGEMGIIIIALQYYAIFISFCLQLASTACRALTSSI